MLNSLRSRLTVWHVVVVAAVLLVYSSGVYVFVWRTLHAHQEARLRAALDVVAADLEATGWDPGSTPAPADALARIDLPNQVVAVLDAQGHVLAKKPVKEAARLCVPKQLMPRTEPQYVQLPDSRADLDDSCLGTYRQVHTAAGSSYYLVSSESDEILSDQLDILQSVLLAGTVLALLVAFAGGWFLARKSLAPLAEMAQTTQRITAENLDERLPVRNPRDELGKLAASFNELLSRLSASFTRQRQFMADASHELRTPVSVMRTTAQVTLEQPHREETEYREALDILEQQTQRLSRVVSDMFTLAQADSGGLTLQAADLYLDETLTEAARSAGILARRKGVTMEVPHFQEAPYHGDEGLLRQMVLNLLENAVKYTPAGGTVRVGLDALGPEYRITVADTGIGIPPEAQAHVFDRFFRVDKSRHNNGDYGGVGLGLSIARWIAEVHRGRLELERSGDSGSVFAVHLPRA
jgi:heavy metal sensor kinase